MNNNDYEKRRKASSWKAPKRQPTENESKKMIAIAIGIAVTLVLKHHCYKVGNKTFHQNNNKGVIGLDLMRCVARVYMINWAGKFKKLCSKISEKKKKIVQ